MKSTQDPTSSQKWVIYATFDIDGAYRPHTIDQVRSYIDLGFQVVVVDSSPSPTSRRMDGWQSTATAWLSRRNEGYDFGSYAAGVDFLKSRGVNSDCLYLLLTNDSCFGPYFRLEPIFEQFDRAAANRPMVFGITDSYETGHHHLQSYWLYFRPNVVKVLIDFLLGERPVPRHRDEAIEFGELALSLFLRSRHCELRAWRPVNITIAHYSAFARWPWAVLELCLRRLIKRPLYGRRPDMACLRFLLGQPKVESRLPNQTLAFGLRMFRDNATPFMKVALLRDNQLDDPMIPTGIDVSQLDNESAAALVNSLFRKRMSEPPAPRPFRLQLPI